MFSRIEEAARISERSPGLLLYASPALWPDVVMARGCFGVDAGY